MDTPSDKPIAAQPSADQALAERLKFARDQRGFSQAAVATRSKWSDPEGKGISRTALIGYENGSSRPGARELRILCEVLAVTPNWMLLGTDDAFKSQHVAMELAPQPGRAKGIRDALGAAVVLTALQGHERDAIYSLVFSLAGRQLGDVRLSALHMTGTLMADAVQRELQALLGSTESIEGLPLGDLAERLSQEVRTNRGNRVKFDEDGEPVGGTVTYPDPSL